MNKSDGCNSSFNAQFLKKIQLGMLVEFIRVCEKHNLQYFLLGGSCLGAVRHKGYIPWDDDIDVGLPRQDYEKFLKIAQAELPENIFLQTSVTDRNYLINFAKLRNSDTTFVEKSFKNFKINHGVYIDIFPLDGYKKSLISDFLYQVYAFRIGCEFYNDNKKTSMKNKLLRKLLPILFPDFKKLKEKNNMYMKKNSYDACETVRNFCGAWGLKEIMPKEYFGKGTKAMFEGLEIIIPEKYDEYLTKLYGNYMELPPENKRKPHHYCDVIDLHKSYKYYI